MSNTNKNKSEINFSNPSSAEITNTQLPSTKSQNKTQLTHSLLLLLTAIIWGSSFVAQSQGLETIGPFAFTVLRMPLGTLILIPFIIFEYFHNKKIFRQHNEGTAANELHKLYKRSVLYGIPCGVILAIAGNLQQLGMLHASAGKAGFVTAFYIVLVPVMGIFLKKKTSLLTWIAVAIAMVGLYFLCIGRAGIGGIDPYDFFILGCALVFTCHIHYVDHFGKYTSGLVMSATQFLVACIVSIPFVFLVDQNIFHMYFTWENIQPGVISILYSGLMSCGVAYTLQIIGQKGVNPTLASILMSLESVTSVIAGFFILHQKMTPDQLIGCLIMFAAVILAQIPMPAKKNT